MYALFVTIQCTVFMFITMQCRVQCATIMHCSERARPVARRARNAADAECNVPPRNKMAAVAADVNVGAVVIFTT